MKDGKLVQESSASQAYSKNTIETSKKVDWSRGINTNSFVSNVYVLWLYLLMNYNVSWRMSMNLPYTEEQVIFKVSMG